MYVFLLVLVHYLLYPPSLPYQRKLPSRPKTIHPQTDHLAQRVNDVSQKNRNEEVYQRSVERVEGPRNLQKRP